MKRKRPPDDGPRPAQAAPRRHRLPSEDEALWRHIAGSVQSLKGAKARVPTAGEVAPAGQPPSIVADHHPHPHYAGPSRRDLASHSKPQATPSQATLPHRHGPPPLAEFERRKVRRIAAGTVSIEARLDLHGARQSEAHHRLKGFLNQCVSVGMSTVLVITGKGGRRQQLAVAAFDDLDARDHGVLRRSVPMWLSEPDMRTIVVSFTTAHARHGGEGALYVHLRRKWSSGRR